jgi:hypothetical protein
MQQPIGLLSDGAVRGYVSRLECAAGRNVAISPFVLTAVRRA